MLLGLRKVLHTSLYSDPKINESPVTTSSLCSLAKVHLRVSAWFILALTEFIAYNLCHFL
uniref:Uncharacterized protein n=1 Tax=Arundo donax TaxID=35708 RepID=A0A0A9CUZ8_ARUDO